MYVEKTQQSQPIQLPSLNLCSRFGVFNTVTSLLKCCSLCSDNLPTTYFHFVHPAVKTKKFEHYHKQLYCKIYNTDIIYN